MTTVSHGRAGSPVGDQDIELGVVSLTDLVGPVGLPAVTSSRPATGTPRWPSAPATRRAVPTSTRVHCRPAMNAAQRRATRSSGWRADPAPAQASAGRQLWRTPPSTAHHGRMARLAGVTVRAVRDDDDLDALNVHNPEWMGATLERRLHNVTDFAPIGMLIAERDGEPVGFGTYLAAGVTDGHRALVSVYVRPHCRGAGVGSALWAAALAACPPDLVRGVTVHLDEDDVRSRDIALAQGLHLGGLHVESQLDLVGVDVAHLRRRAVAPAGLVVTPLAPDATEVDWQEFAALEARLEADTPDHATGSVPMPYGILRAFVPEPWQVMVARHGDVMIGVTAVTVRYADNREVNTLMTGVSPEYRGRGLATALKAAHGLALREVGWRRIRTQNMDGNVPILAANATLGFRRFRTIRDVTWDHLVGASSAEPPGARDNPPRTVSPGSVGSF